MKVILFFLILIATVGKDVGQTGIQLVQASRGVVRQNKSRYYGQAKKSLGSAIPVPENKIIE